MCWRPASTVTAHAATESTTETRLPPRSRFVHRNGNSFQTYLPSLQQTAACHALKDTCCAHQMPPSHVATCTWQHLMLRHVQLYTSRRSWSPTATASTHQQQLSTTPACACLQNLLKDLGIVVDSTTVIQQAAVTGLSDSNSESTAPAHGVCTCGLCMMLVSPHSHLSADARGILCSTSSNYTASPKQEWLSLHLNPHLPEEPPW
jgi:hypothetical protein